MSLPFPSNKVVGRIGAPYRKIANGQGKPLHACVRSGPAPSTVNRDAHCRKRASLHFRFWHKCEVSRRPPCFRFLGKSGSDTDSPVAPAITFSFSFVV